MQAGRVERTQDQELEHRCRAHPRQPTAGAQRPLVTVIIIINKVFANCKVLDRHKARPFASTAHSESSAPGNRMGLTELAGESAPAWAGHPHLTWLARAGPASRRRGAVWLTFTTSSRGPFTGWGWGCRVHADPIVPRLGGPRACVWVSRDREWQRLWELGSISHSTLGSSPVDTSETDLGDQPASESL